MIILLHNWLISLDPHFAVLNYLSLRTIASGLTALMLSLILVPIFVHISKHRKYGQVVRDDGPQTHLGKSGTPTMGGLVILLVVLFSSLLWSDLTNSYIQVVLVTFIAFGIIGFTDDWLKVAFVSSKGLAPRYKYAAQSVVALAIATWLYLSSNHENILLIPVIKDLYIPLGWGAIVLTYFVIVGSSNAVNLTDGLDGLVIMPVALIAGALGCLAYVSGHIHFADYLNLAYLAGSGELIVFCGALVGAGLGFLWFNSYPALLFMGDVGSLSLGAVLGVLAVLIHQELLFFVMGGVFVAEAISVILQVGSFKLRGKRIFKMAPLHHHYELKGWPETKVITRFWIVTVILVLLALACLKLR